MLQRQASLHLAQAAFHQAPLCQGSAVQAEALDLTRQVRLK